MPGLFDFSTMSPYDQKLLGMSYLGNAFGNLQAHGTGQPGPSMLAPMLQYQSMK